MGSAKAARPMPLAELMKKIRSWHGNFHEGGHIDIANFSKTSLPYTRRRIPYSITTY